MERKRIIFYLAKIGGIALIIIISIGFLLFSLRPKLEYFKKAKEEMKKNQMIIEKFDRDKAFFQKETEDEIKLWQEVRAQLDSKIKTLGSEEEIFSHFSSLLRELKDKASSLGIRQLMLQSQSKSFTINVNPDPSFPLFIKGIKETGFENVEGEEDVGEPLGKLSYIGFKILYTTDIRTSSIFLRSLPSLSNLLSIEKIEVYAQESQPIYVIYLKFYFKRMKNAQK